MQNNIVYLHKGAARLYGSITSTVNINCNKYNSLSSEKEATVNYCHNCYVQHQSCGDAERAAYSGSCYQRFMQKHYKSLSA